MGADVYAVVEASGTTEPLAVGHSLGGFRALLEPPGRFVQRVSEFSSTGR